MTMNISVVRQILEWNEDKSGEIAALLREKNVFMINLMGSPGAGKTSLIAALSETIAAIASSRTSGESLPQRSSRLA